MNLIINLLVLVIGVVIAIWLVGMLATVIAIPAIIWTIVRVIIVLAALVYLLRLFGVSTI